MSTPFRVKPAPGLTILNPDRENRPLDPAGEDVPRSSYWLRRLRDGDVVDAAEASPAPAAKAKK